jgi:hypothetical protein
LLDSSIWNCGWSLRYGRREFDNEPYQNGGIGKILKKRKKNNIIIKWRNK